MKTCPYLLHALSPLHAGTGQSVGAIDLPIARLRATGMPFVPASSLKGVLRAARGEGSGGAPPLSVPEVSAVFGPPTDADTSAHAGAVVVGDARLLSLPVRSFVGTFVWATSPLLLRFARRDLEGMAGLPATIPSVPGRAARVPAMPAGNAPAGATPSRAVHRSTAGPRVILEDLDLPVDADPVVRAWAEYLAPWVVGADSTVFVERFVVLDDETMTFLWETATQVDTRVRIDPATRTVAKGALWVEESLPAETVLVGLLAADRTRGGGPPLEPEEVLQLALPAPLALQVGGKATVGRGFCRLVPVREETQ